MIPLARARKLAEKVCAELAPFCERLVRARDVASVTQSIPVGSFGRVE